MSQIAYANNETGLSEYSGTSGTVSRNSSSPLHGSYDLQLDTNAVNYAYFTISKTDIYIGFEIRIPSISDLAQYSSVVVAQAYFANYTYANLSLFKSTTGAGHPNCWGFAGASTASTTTAAGRHWVTMHIVCNSATISGYDLYVDGTLIKSNFALDWSARTSITRVAVGVPTGATSSTYTVNFDELLIDDATRPSDPDSSGSAVPKIIAAIMGGR